MKSKRFGKLYISNSVLSSTELPEVLYKAKFIPTRVEYVAHMGCFEYIGTSELFEEVEEGTKLIEYNLIIQKDNNEIIDVKAERVSQ